MHLVTHTPDVFTSICVHRPNMVNTNHTVVASGDSDDSVGASQGAHLKGRVAGLQRGHLPLQLPPLLPGRICKILLALCALGDAPLQLCHPALLCRILLLYHTGSQLTGHTMTRTARRLCRPPYLTLQACMCWLQHIASATQWQF